MRAWAAAAAVALLAATGPGLAPRSPAAWRPLFAADFSDPLVPPECAPFDAPHTAPAASYYRPDEVRVAGGVLHLSLRRRDFGGRPYTSGGIGCVRLAQTYGRYEFHAKVPPGDPRRRTRRRRRRAQAVRPAFADPAALGRLRGEHRGCPYRPPGRGDRAAGRVRRRLGARVRLRRRRTAGGPRPHQRRWACAGVAGGRRRGGRPAAGPGRVRPDPA